MRALDPARRKSTTTVGSFAAIFLLGSAGMAVAAFVPGPREFFRLRFGEAFAWFAPPIALGFAMGLLEAKGKLSLRAFGALSLAGMFLFQSFMWSLVALTEVPGSTVMAAFPILLVSFHGHLYQSSLRLPFSFLATLLALCVGSLLGGVEHAAIFAIAGPMALGSHLLLGYYAHLDYQARLEREALRAAVDAQILNARVADMARVSSILMELRGRSHDAGNALSGLLLNVPHFVSLLERVEGEPDRAHEAIALGRALSARLQTLKALLTESSELARRSDVRAVALQPWKVLSETVDEIGELHRTVRFETKATDRDRELRVPFYGGEVALRRVLSNLLLNACEGDGRRGAKHVQIELAFDDEEGSLSIRIADDGPGFSAEQLSRAFDRLETTKRSGSGLGFYTASRVLAASSGMLLRKNRPDGAGAEVTVELRAALEGT